MRANLLCAVLPGCCWLRVGLLEWFLRKLIQKGQGYPRPSGGEVLEEAHLEWGKGIQDHLGEGFARKLIPKGQAYPRPCRGGFFEDAYL